MKTSNKRLLNAKSIGIDLSSKNEAQLFRWLLACLLFGRPIQQDIAVRAYEQIIAAGITSISELAVSEWDTLVKLLDEAHYVRYDFSTATKLLDLANTLSLKYGSVSGLIEKSSTIDKLRQNLLEFRGVGPVTVEIFTRDIGPIWYKQPD